MYKRKWKPSKKQKREFIETMNEIEEFCLDNNIIQSRDSYYFTLNNKRYRISNHTRAASNKKAFNHNYEQVREQYHDLEDTDLIEITASKTRIIEIYNDLKAGLELNKRGYRR